MEPRGEGASEERGDRKIPDQHSLCVRMPVRGTRAGTPSSPAPAPPKMTAPPGPGLAAAPHPRAQSGVHASPGGPCAAVPLASGPPPRISQEAGGAARRAGSLPPGALRPARRRGRLSSTARLIRGY